MQIKIMLNIEYIKKTLMGKMTALVGWQGDTKNPYLSYILNGFETPEPT